jgi:thiosulfate/3-mercaptopyruvate sulfurtransferase
VSPFGPLVSAPWLAAHLDEVRVVDTRWYVSGTNTGTPGGRTGRQAYLDAHIPTAVFLDIDTDLAAPPGVAEGRHPLPSPQEFAAVLSRAGISAGTPVVAYDDTGGSIAARLWWMLHVLGEPVAVLDGGLAAWTGPLTERVPTPAAVPREPTPWPADRIMAADALLTSGRAIIDARTAERFARGDPSIDPCPGHVPGAVSAPWASNLDGNGHFLGPAALRDRYAALGVSGPAVAYCGSGVTSCHTVLALTLAGTDDVALYPGSWSQWGADPARPVEIG